MTIATVMESHSKFDNGDYYRHAMAPHDDYYRHSIPAHDDYYQTGILTKTAALDNELVEPNLRVDFRGRHPKLQCDT